MKKFVCVILSAFIMLTSIVGLAACNKDNSEGNVVITYIQGDRDKPDFELLEKLVKTLKKPIFLEGRVWYPEEVKKAFEIGAHSVVIGSAVTRPHLITKRFTNF